MMYEHIVAKLRKVYQEKDASFVGRHFAIQFNIWGEGHGALYLEIKDDRVFVEPYEYFDRDTLISTDADTLLGIADGRIDPTNYGDLYVEGDFYALDLLKELTYDPSLYQINEEDEDQSEGLDSEKDSAETVASNVIKKAEEAAETVKEKAEGAAETVKEKAEGAAEVVKETAGKAKKKAGQAAGKARKKAGQAKKKAGEAAGKAREKAGEAAEVVKEKAGGAAEVVKEKAEGAAEVVKEKAEGAADVVKEKAEGVSKSRRRSK